MPVIYSRNALPVMHGFTWHGNFGGISRWYMRHCMSEEITAGKSLLSVDRSMMNYVHANRIRHQQLRHSYSHESPMYRRATSLREFAHRQRIRKIQNGFRAVVHHEIKRTLEEKAMLVNKYGQAAVNEALGDTVARSTPNMSAAERTKVEGKINAIHRKVTVPEVQLPVPKHVVTPRQRKPARFDRRHSVFER